MIYKGIGAYRLRSEPNSPKRFTAVLGGSHVLMHDQSSGKWEHAIGVYEEGASPRILIMTEQEFEERFERIEKK